MIEHGKSCDTEIRIYGQGEVDLQRRYKLIAWLRYPLPGTPVRREVMGTNLNSIASGLACTVWSHFEWFLQSAFPPLLDQIRDKPCIMQPSHNHEARILYIDLCIDVWLTSLPDVSVMVLNCIGLDSSIRLNISGTCMSSKSLEINRKEIML